MAEQDQERDTEGFFDKVGNLIDRVVDSITGNTGDEVRGPDEAAQNETDTTMTSADVPGNERGALHPDALPADDDFADEGALASGSRISDNDLIREDITGAAGAIRGDNDLTADDTVAEADAVIAADDPFEDDDSYFSGGSLNDTENDPIGGDDLAGGKELTGNEGGLIGGDDCWMSVRDADGRSQDTGTSNTDDPEGPIGGAGNTGGNVGQQTLGGGNVGEEDGRSGENTRGGSQRADATHFRNYDTQQPTQEE